MKDVKITPKIKQHYIDKGYISEQAEIGSIIRVRNEDYVSPKSFSTYTIWMFFESKVYKEICKNVKNVDIKRLKEVCDFIRTDTKKFSSHTILRRIAYFIKYDLEGSYKERLIKILNYPKHKKSDNLDYLILLYGEEEGTKRFNEKKKRLIGENNPAYKHGGLFSPYSKKFIKYKSLSEKEKEQTIKILSKKKTKTMIDNHNNPLSIDYYIKQGLSKKQAKEKLKERQSTFSLKKCIEKYGEQEGLEIWKKRQDKWLKTLNNKSKEEKSEINRKKLSNLKRSNFEKEIFNELKKHIPNIKSNLLIKQKYQEQWFSFDIYLNNKIVEVNGDFWHMNPEIFKETDNRINETAADVWSYDKLRYETAKKQGYEIFIIWEKEYTKNKKEVIDKCLNFLKQ